MEFFVKFAGIEHLFPKSLGFFKFSISTRDYRDLLSRFILNILKSVCDDDPETPGLSN